MVSLQEQESGIQRSGSGRGQASSINLVNIKVARATADLLKVYCVFHNHRMAEVATRIIERELQEFKKRLESMRRI